METVNKVMMKRFISLIFFVVLMGNDITACTIFCAKDHKGQVWAANNEDGSFTFYNYINVFPKTEDTKYGYFTFSYYSPKNGFGGGVEGGANEAGLFFDFNSIDRKPVKDLKSKKLFPGGDDAILTHLLANFSTVQEVVDFFDTYWFELGFTSAQMHVVDRYGGMAMISASGSRILQDAPYQISTNFDICGKEDGSSCWRYPIINEKLEDGIKDQKIGQPLFAEICDDTAVKGRYSNYTMYSNIHNLSTGELWFYFTSDYKNPYKTSIQELLAKGRKSYLIKDLFPNHPLTQLHKTYTDEGGGKAFSEFLSLDLSKERKDEIASIFVNAVLAENYDLSLLPFLDDHMDTNPYGYWKRALWATLYHQKGDKERAVSIVKEYQEKVPTTSMDVEGILDLFDGKFPEDHNTVIELHGHEDAKQVFVDGLPVDFNFLIWENGKWVGRYNLEGGIYEYRFLVDGKEVLDTKTPIKRVPSSYEVDTFINRHQMAVGYSPQVYQTTIVVTVPHKDDIVFIVGEQQNLGGESPVFRLRKVSDHVRKIEIELHYPVRFRFVNADWTKEGIMTRAMDDPDQEYPLLIDSDTVLTDYQISGWKERVKK